MSINVWEQRICAYQKDIGLLEAKLEGLRQLADAMEQSWKMALVQNDALRIRAETTENRNYDLSKLLCETVVFLDIAARGDQMFCLVCNKGNDCLDDGSGLPEHTSDCKLENLIRRITANGQR